MNITAHCRERYVERIQGIKNTNQIKQIAKDSLEDIEQKIINLFDKAELVFEGSLNRKQAPRRFFVSEDIILVADLEQSNLLTLYKVDFGFPERTNRTVLSDLLEELKEKEEDVYNKRESYETFKYSKEFEIENMETEIESFENHIDLLKNKKQSITQQINNQKQEVDINTSDRDKLCRIICNSLDYKKDMLSGMR